MTTRVTGALPHPVPDRAGGNAFLDDPELESLLGIYMAPELLAHLRPHLCQLGEQVAGPLDELAHLADQNPPTLQHRSRAGLDLQRVLKHPAYVKMEKLAFGTYGLAAMSHRAGVLGWPTPMPPVAK